MDVFGRILRAWMPAIHAGMTLAIHSKIPSNIGLGMYVFFHPPRASVRS
jgi:hypothetical protein